MTDANASQRATTATPSTLRQAWRVYNDPRMLTLALLGFSSGLPLLLVYSTLSFWLLDEGLKIATVGLFAATATPYSLKFLWAPLLDRAPLPWLTRRFGQRRGWLLAIQTSLTLAMLGVAATDPGQNPTLTAIAAIVVATLSASQDVVIDAYRVERLAPHEQGAGAAVAVFGYRLGMLAASAGALYAAHYLESWPATYTLMASLMAVGIATTSLCQEPPPPARDDASPWRAARDAFVGPFQNMISRRGWVAFLLFIMLYKLGDALASTMTNPLLYELGFQKLTIADVGKTYGLLASILGVFIGGAVVRSLGVVRALWVGGLAQMASNLMFVFQATVGHDLSALIATIGVENLTGGLGTAAFVAYLSALCQREYTASQYALMTALAGLLKTLLTTTAGLLVASFGWVAFFLMSTAAALPGLGLLLLLQRQGWTGLKTTASPSPTPPNDADAHH